MSPTVRTVLDPAVPLLTARTIEQQIDSDIPEDRLLMTLSGFFGGLALLLAAVGLYGVISYAVGRRTREIGIRMALGAERQSVDWLVTRYAVGLVLLGQALGVGIHASELIHLFFQLVEMGPPAPPDRRR